MQRSTEKNWVEIDVETVIENLKQITCSLDEKVKLIAVVKANAYGHGSAGIARILEAQGVSYFAVTYLDEALKLRKAGVRSDILLLSPCGTEAQLQEAITNRLTLTIGSGHDARLLLQFLEDTEVSVKVHIKVETGLGRFGMAAAELLETCQRLAHNSRINLEGIYTHMAEATSTSFTEKQFHLFSQIVAELERNQLVFPLKHCANSSVFIKYPQMRLNAVRIGTLISGQYPAGVSGDLKLADPFHFKSRVIAVKKMSKGESLGYYRTYRLKRDAQVAVISAGYIDGLALEVGNQPTDLVDFLKILLKSILAYFGWTRFIRTVRIRGKDYPLRGKIFMQMALAEIPLEDEVYAGDEVELTVRKTLVNPQITRFYKYKGQVWSETEICTDTNMLGLEDV